MEMGGQVEIPHAHCSYQHPGAFPEYTFHVASLGVVSRGLKKLLLTGFAGALLALTETRLFRWPDSAILSMSLFRISKTASPS